MNLLSYGVASANVGKVIQVVWKLCGRIPNQVPARQTVDNINRQRLAVAHKQLQETFSDAENVTLYTDETSRKGHKYTVYATTTGTATAVLGVQELVSKSAQDTLQGLIDVVNRTAAVCSQEELSAEIVASLKNTMSDRASTEKLFNKLLQSYRASILPTVIRKWNELTPKEQTDSVRMNNFFFCGLHLTVALADSFCAAIKSLEKDMDPVGAGAKDETRMFTNRSECSVERFVRSSCKMCVLGSDEKSGCPDFSTYLKLLGKHNSLIEFAHNRFNVLFYDGGEVFALSDDIKNYITKYHTPPNTTNALIKAVYLTAAKLGV